jgi:hypothetical protein
MDLNTILDRTEIHSQIRDILVSFTTIPIWEKRSIYIYGESGIGKTTFVCDILNELNYDIIQYDSDHARNPQLIESLSNSYISHTNVFGSLNKTPKKIAIVIDDIDSMNTGDKGGLLALTKLIRPKKTKKQKNEPYNSTPIICIGNTVLDKSVRELYKVCRVFELTPPSISQMTMLIHTLFEISHDIDVSSIYEFVHSDIAKLYSMRNIYGTNYLDLIHDIHTFFIPRVGHYDIKTKTCMLLNNAMPLSQHATLINEPERTIINKLLHENIVDMFYPEVVESIPVYTDILKNICYADYLDRATFQRQIWQLSEMSSLIKTFKTSHMLRNYCNAPTQLPYAGIRFTKILTKYSTEYNNFIFIRQICQTLNIDKRDLIGYMHSISYLSEEQKINMIDIEDIDKSCIARLTKYTNKYTTSSEADDIADDMDVDIETDNNMMSLEYTGII